MTLLPRCGAIALALLCALMPMRHLPAADAAKPAILLVAKPELQDPNFAGAVVLVVFPEGAPVGVILNRPLKLTAKEAFSDNPQLKNRSDTLYLGGPVQPTRLMFLFQQPQIPDRAFAVLEDLYLSADGNVLEQLLAGNGQPVQRFFLGYSGWTASQLEQEIDLGAWYVLPADRRTVLRKDTDTLWRDLILRATAVKA
jgi:putative transcriptional regulator